MLSIRGGSGLGDAIYLQSIVRHFVEQGQRLEVCTDWPDVFRPLEGKIELSPFRRRPISIMAHYSRRRAIAGTTQFEDGVIEAGIHGKIDFRIDWQPVNVDLIQKLKSHGRPIVVVQMPRAPFGRADRFGQEFLPDCQRIQQAINRLKGRVLLVQVGRGGTSHRLSGIDIDLVNRSSVSDFMDVGYVADGFLGYCSNIVPLAESFSKPALLVWARAGLRSQHDVIRTMTPKKILHCATSRAIMDDCSDSELFESVDALYRSIRLPSLV